MIRVINLNTERVPGVVPLGAVYVGRVMHRKKLRGSALGNPHKPDARQGVTRDMCISAFAADLDAAITRVGGHRAGTILAKPTARQERMVAELDRLTLRYLEEDELVLACWCHPQACHANVIATHIENRVSAIRMRMGVK